jgi:hypothetical protein
MPLIQAILYLAAVTLIVLAAFRISTRVSLALLGAGCALLAFALPAITTGI